MFLYKGLRKEYAHIAIKGKHSKSRKANCRSKKIGNGGQLEDARRTLKLERKKETKSK